MVLVGCDLGVLLKEFALLVDLGRLAMLVTVLAIGGSTHVFGLFKVVLVLVLVV